LLELIVLDTIRCKLGGEEGHLLVRFLYGQVVELID
jgi:hypothetical protein